MAGRARERAGVFPLSSEPRANRLSLDHGGGVRPRRAAFGVGVAVRSYARGEQRRHSAHRLFRARGGALQRRNHLHRARVFRARGGVSYLLCENARARRGKRSRADRGQILFLFRRARRGDVRVFVDRRARGVRIC